MLGPEITRKLRQDLVTPEAWRTSGHLTVTDQDLELRKVDFEGETKLLKTFQTVYCLWVRPINFILWIRSWYSENSWWLVHPFVETMTKRDCVVKEHCVDWIKNPMTHWHIRWPRNFMLLSNHCILFPCTFYNPSQQNSLNSNANKYKSICLLLDWLTKKHVYEIHNK